MCSDIDWYQNRNHNEEVCPLNSASVSAYGKFFLDGRLTFLGPGDEEKWYGTSPTNLMGNGTSLQKI